MTPRQINSRFSLNVGIRLFLAACVLLMGKLSAASTGHPELIMTSMILAAVVMKWPGFHYVKGILADTLTEEQKSEQLLMKVKEAAATKVNELKAELQLLAAEARKGLIDEKKFNEELKTITDKLQKFDAEKFAKYEETLQSLQNALLEQGKKLKKFEDGGAEEGEQRKSLRSALKDMFQTEDWKAFVDSNGKKKASFEMKAVSITDNYTGTPQNLITTRSTRVIDHPPVTRLNIRDLITVAPTDLPYLAFLEVYDWVRNIKLHTENERLAESSFKVREAVTDVKRIGTHIVISKRMLRSLPFLQSHLETRIPALVRYFEDFYLLFGDGVGLNPTGIFKVADDFATIINTSLTGSAGAVASVATYNGGASALITFAANQNINNGDKITIANATNAGYNDTFSAKVIGPRQIVIDETFVTEADTSAWTFTVASRFKNAIFAAQYIDVLKVAKSLVTRQEYQATGIVLHPDDAVFIETLKGNDEHYLDVQRLESGVLTIAGVPVVETTAMPSGFFAVGDWRMAAALFEFTPLRLEFSESTEEKLTNTVVAIVQEEVLFPIYNKYMFVTGNFDTAKAAILLGS